MSVILQVRLNGGAPQTGGVDVEDGDVIQQTAASKANWGSPAAEWRIHSYPAEFPLPAGWSSDADGYYYIGNSDPPPITANRAVWWGKLGLRLTASDGGRQIIDEATAICLPSTSGYRGLFSGETTQFGGTRESWVAEMNRDFKTLNSGGGALEIVDKDSGQTLQVHALNLLDDNGSVTPTFPLPAPSTWPGRVIVAKRLNQPAAEVTITVTGGALIDGAASYTLVGPDVCAEFYSDGTRVLVGPTSTVASADWTPASIPGAYFWAKGISDPTLRTMTGSRIDTMQNGIPSGVSITRSAGTPIIDTTKVRNGYNPMVMDSTTNLGSASGGPVGNAPHCIIILTDGSDATAFTGFVRAGAVGGSGGLGLTTSGRYAAGLVAGEGVPQVASPEPLADGALRMLHCQHRPNYGYLMVGIDGRAPIAASGSAWAHTKTLALDGSFAFSNIEAGRTPNASPIWDAVLVNQEVSAGDLARLAAYWKAKFSLPDLSPMIHVFGDSLADPGPISPATTNWPSVMKTTLDAQLTVDGRMTTDMLNSALSGKMLNGVVWASGSPNICRQADGLYPTIVLTSAQGIHYSAPYSRSGRRKYDIAMGGAATNDIINAARTDTQIIEDLKYVFDRFINQSRYDGIVWHTIPAGSNLSGYFDGARGTYRTAVNGWLVNTAKSGGFLRDIDEVVDFDAAGLVWNTTYYGAGPDSLHQNDTGKALMASAMYTAVYRLIRKLDP